MNTFSGVLFLGLVACAVYGIPGGPMEQDPESQLIKDMAEFAVGEIGSEYTLVRVVSGSTQVVNGILYNIQLVAKRNIAGKDQRRRCNVLVYEIHHQGYKELEEFHCHFKNKEPRL